MKREEIRLRDPFVLTAAGTYYLYGTRSATTWGEADGLDCYTSGDLVHWDGPFEIYHKPENSPFTCCYWAPECYAEKGGYCLVTTLGKAGNRTGIYALTAGTPRGPFGGKRLLTPKDWRCIDGTLYRNAQGLFLVFSRSFEDYPDGGDLWGVKLRETDGRISGPEGEPFKLFDARDAGWNEPVPFARAFGIKGEVYLSDGPCLLDAADGKLVLLWSSWHHGGYAVGAAVSLSGRVEGPYRHISAPLVPDNAGHGMAFTALDGTRYFALHAPNDPGRETPTFYPLVEKNGAFQMERR